jgi:hypothetical protein
LQSYQSRWHLPPGRYSFDSALSYKSLTLKITIMKRIFILLLATIATIFTFTSCNKDLQVAPVPAEDTYKVVTSPLTLDLVAGDWINNGDGIHVNTFKNIIPARYFGHSTKVYLLTEEGETQINHFISFKGGKLWASLSGTDVTLIYHSLGQRLFDNLKIKVVIE